MGGVCGTYGDQESCIHCFGGGNKRERDHLEDPSVDGFLRNGVGRHGLSYGDSG